MTRRRLLVAGGAVLARALLAGLWLTWVETYRVVRAYRSDAARADRYLAARRLLAAEGHPLRTLVLLDERTASTLPAGTLLLDPVAGQPEQRTADALLAWVRAGNTLVMTPQYTRIGAPGARGALGAVTDPDPIGRRYGASVEARADQDTDCRLDPSHAVARDEDDDEEKDDKAPAPHLVCVLPPGAAHVLELARPYMVLRQDAHLPPPAWSDPHGLGVAVYREGRGQVVMLASGYFDNQDLRRFDHAELLLALAGLSGRGTPVLAVQGLSNVGWPALVWRAAWPVLVALACALALALWRAGRRFGPPLPDAVPARRAPLEHVDAAGRWLWRAEGGRGRLLAATRAAAERVLARRAPGSRLLIPTERCRQLAEASGLSAQDLHEALYAPAATRAADFTRQISTLHRLRAHYER
jgi:hypothetical protein